MPRNPFRKTLPNSRVAQVEGEIQRIKRPRPEIVASHRCYRSITRGEEKLLITKTDLKDGTTRITFTLEDERPVSVVGDFNEWNPHAHQPLNKLHEIFPFELLWATWFMLGVRSAWSESTQARA